MHSVGAFIDGAMGWKISFASFPYRESEGIFGWIAIKRLKNPSMLYSS